MLSESDGFHSLTSEGLFWGCDRCVRGQLSHGEALLAWFMRSACAGESPVHLQARLPPAFSKPHVPFKGSQPVLLDCGFLS